MKAFSRLRTPVWLAPRAYWCIAIVALLFAAGAAAPAFAVLAAACGALLIAGVVIDAVTGPRRSQIQVRRIEPSAFALGRSGELRYAVLNLSRAAARVGIYEAPISLLAYRSDEVVTDVAAQSEARAARAVEPASRGTAPLHELYVWYESPIALLRRRMCVPAECEIRVYPDLSAVERYGSLHARNRLIEAGLRRLRLRGAGTEPESVREWSPGDAFRAVNWKATARRGRLMVAQYEVERSQHVMILIDAGRLMTARAGNRRKMDYAVTAALSVASIASFANDKTGMVAFAGRILRACAPRSSGRSAASVASLMHDLEPQFEESDYDAAFAYVRGHVRKRSLILLFTDMVDPVAQSSVIAQIGTLCRHHVVVCAFMNDAAIDDALEAEQRTPRDAYAAGVALELRSERKHAAAVLARMGVRVIDVPAQQLTTALIDQYLQIKQRGLL